MLCKIGYQIDRKRIRIHISKGTRSGPAKTKQQMKSGAKSASGTKSAARVVARPKAAGLLKIQPVTGG